MKDRDIPQLVDIKEADIPTNVVINGVQQTNKGLTVNCPDCSMVILSFNTMYYLGVCDICNQQADNLPKYCSNCGQRLAYKREKVLPEDLSAKI